jgi:hypothetical protein
MAKPKPSAQGPATYAKGGTTKMFKRQTAGLDRPGNTGKDQTETVVRPKYTVGGLAMPAMPGCCGTDDARKGK